jgi:hypothetical protein
MSLASIRVALTSCVVSLALLASSAPVAAQIQAGIHAGEEPCIGLGVAGEIDLPGAGQNGQAIAGLIGPDGTLHFLVAMELVPAAPGLDGFGQLGGLMFAPTPHGFLPLTFVFGLYVGTPEGEGLLRLVMVVPSEVPDGEPIVLGELVAAYVDPLGPGFSGPLQGGAAICP